MSSYFRIDGGFSTKDTALLQDVQINTQMRVEKDKTGKFSKQTGAKGYKEYEEIKEYEKPDVVTRQQINQALMDIEDTHPLKSKAKLEHIIPAFACFKRYMKRKPDFNHALRCTLLKELDLKMPKSDSKTSRNPFLMLGYGVNAYFDILISMAWMCLMITIFMFPVTWVYANNRILGL